MKRFHWFFVAAGSVALFACLALACTVDDRRFRTCFRDGFHQFLSMGFIMLSLGAGAWLGVEVARFSRRPWLGWVCGVVGAFTIAMLFHYLGFEIHGE